MHPYHYPVNRISSPEDPHIALRLVGDNGVYGDGDSMEAALASLREAFLSLCDALQSRGQAIPLPGDAADADTSLKLDWVTSLRVALHNEMRNQNVTALQLAQRLNVEESTVNEMLDFFHTDIQLQDLIEALVVLGRNVTLHVA